MNVHVEKSLLSLVPLKSQFSRSTRIDQDVLGDGNFIYSGSIDLFLNTLVSHQESEVPQGAYTWTGPYGSGKSTLALSLLSILRGPKEAREAAAKAYTQVTAERIWAAFPPRSKGWRAVTVIGQRMPLALAISNELKKQKLMAKNVSETPENIISSVEKFIRKSDKNGGLFLIIDEIGKLLEHSVASDGDVYLYQL